MNPGTLRFSAILTAAAFAFAGCASDPSGAPGPFSNNATGAASDITRSMGTAHSESLVSGSVAGSAISATIVVIAKHEATPRQRQVAQQRARVAVRRMAARRSEEPTTSPSAQRKKTGTSAAGTTVAKKMKKLPRYIAVDTEKDEKTAPKAKKAVMIFDTEAEEVVGNSVYDVASVPQVGATAKFETYAAQYVGTGF